MENGTRWRAVDRDAVKGTAQRRIKYITTVGCVLVFGMYLTLLPGQTPAAHAQKSKSNAHASMLRAEQDEKTQTIKVYRNDGKEPILTQNAIQDNRPYLHPIVAPDGKGLLTQYRPAHHPHQTGIFWGFKLVNGREFFMQWQGDHYRRVSAKVVEQKGPRVKWQTVYDLLDNEKAVMTETQNWSMQELNGQYILDLEWKGEAKTDITLGKTYVGGLFVRIPWHEGIRAEAVNAVGQRDHEIEQQHAIWTDVGIQIDGRDDLGHFAIFDHPDNRGFPVPWRVDSQFGFGPNLVGTGFRIDKGKTEVFHYRLIGYTGELDPVEMTHKWKEFIKESN